MTPNQELAKAISDLAKAVNRLADAQARGAVWQGGGYTTYVGAVGMSGVAYGGGAGGGGGSGIVSGRGVGGSSGIVSGYGFAGGPVTPPHDGQGPDVNPATGDERETTDGEAA